MSKFAREEEEARNEHASLSVDGSIEYVDYSGEDMLPDVQRLVSKDLSEPYSVFLYRYFLYNWPNLCVCAYARDVQTGERGEMVATIVSKCEDEKDCVRGYIAMLAVSSSHRKKGIGLELATRGLDRMVLLGCEEVVLEAELSNVGALALYEKLGFMRDEKMGRYYLNGGDAYRLKLCIDKRPSWLDEKLMEQHFRAAEEKGKEQQEEQEEDKEDKEEKEEKEEEEEQSSGMLESAKEASSSAVASSSSSSSSCSDG